MKLHRASRPDPETIARWWVQLNCWIWPDDMPGRPNPPGGMTQDQERYAIRGAHSVLDLFADEALVTAIWQDDIQRRRVLNRDRES